MKFTKTAMLGALALASCNILADGATVVRFTGSTAFRAVVHAALQRSGSGKVWDSAPIFGYTGASGVSGATASEFSGTISSVPVLIKCTWAGSEGGIQTVDQNGTGLAIWFVDPTNTGQPTVGGVATALSSGGTANLDDPTATANETSSRAENAIPDACFSDTYQASSQFSTAGTVQYHGATYPALTPASGTGVHTGGVIGIIPFEFVASKGSTITNITSQLFRTLAVNGQTVRGQFAGNSSDQTPVTLIGRDSDSGTRLTTLAETGYGATKSVTQYYPYNSSNGLISTVNQTIASVNEVPASTVDGIPLAVGNGGYSSGGNLSKAICGDTQTDSVGDLITYLGASDGNNAINAVTTSFSNYPAVQLQYNGVTPSAAAIENGTYTFWGYEHVYYRSGSSVASYINGVAVAVAAEATGTATIAGSLPINIAYGDMICNRTLDGATVNLN